MGAPRLSAWEACACRSQWVLMFEVIPARTLASRTIRVTRDRSSGFPERDANTGPSSPALALSPRSWPTRRAAGRRRACALLCRGSRYAQPRHAQINCATAARTLPIAEFAGRSFHSRGCEASARQPESAQIGCAAARARSMETRAVDARIQELVSLGEDGSWSSTSTSASASLRSLLGKCASGMPQVIYAKKRAEKRASPRSV